jgi:hypothetical protein
MVSAGLATTPHIWGELFKMIAGVDMLQVPYRSGGPALCERESAHSTVRNVCQRNAGWTRQSSR